MPSGMYDRTQKRKSSIIDDRSVLSLLPGRLIGKQRLEEELHYLKEQIRNGQHREYMALIPGLELEITEINKGLASMADLLGFGQRADGSAADGLAESREQANDRVKALPEAKNAIDVNDVLGPRRSIKGKPALGVLVLQEFIEQNNKLNVDHFIKRWQLNDNRNIRQLLSATICKLRKRKLNIPAVKNGTYRLLTAITGQPQLLLSSAGNSESPAKPSKLSKPSKVAKPSPEQVTPNSLNHSKEKFQGSRNSVLIQEFRAGGGVVDMSHLAKKYKASDKYTYNWAMNSLKDRGYEFERVGTGIFRMTKEGRDIS